MKVILAGGGTGGHLYPGIAVAEKLKENHIDTLFLVSNRGIDRKILEGQDYEFVEQNVTAVKGKSIIYKIVSLFKLFGSIIGNMKRIKSCDKVLLLGGFASASAGLGALLKRADIYIHEQNSVMGFTNRFFARFSEKVFLSFENTLKSGGNIVFTGNPVRKSVMNIKPKSTINRNVLILGGSQGSRFINELVADCADLMLKNGMNIVHQTGTNLYRETLERYKNRGVSYSNLEITGYLNDINEKLEWSDVIISRAGSGSVFEIINSLRPAVLIPLKTASDNHQYYNARFFTDRGFGELITEDQADPELLYENISAILENYDRYTSKMEEWSKLDSAETIVQEMGLI